MPLLTSLQDFVGKEKKKRRLQFKDFPIEQTHDLITCQYTLQLQYCDNRRKEQLRLRLAGVCFHYYNLFPHKYHIPIAINLICQNLQ